MWVCIGNTSILIEIPDYSMFLTIMKIMHLTRFSNNIKKSEINIFVMLLN